MVDLVVFNVRRSRISMEAKSELSGGYLNNLTFGWSSFVFFGIPSKTSKQVIIHNSEVTALRCCKSNEPHVFGNGEETWNICFGVVASRTTFVGFGRSGRGLQSISNLFRCHIHRSTSRYLCR